jgi:hypothetical protein
MPHLDPFLTQCRAQQSCCKDAEHGAEQLVRRNNYAFDGLGSHGNLSPETSLGLIFKADQ